MFANAKRSASFGGRVSYKENCIVPDRLTGNPQCDGHRPIGSRAFWTPEFELPDKGNVLPL